MRACVLVCVHGIDSVVSCYLREYVASILTVSFEESVLMIDSEFANFSSASVYLYLSLSLCVSVAVSHFSGLRPSVSIFIFAKQRANVR